MATRGTGRGPGRSARPAASARPRARGARAERTARTGEQPAVASSTTSGRAVEAAGPGRRRPKLTGRAVVLLVVLAVLMASYASSLRAYLHQRDNIGDLKTEIAEREQAIDALQTEKRRWEDPAYTAQQARERFGYVMPGQRSYVVVDENGEPIQGGARLEDPDEVVKEEPTPWWDGAWASVELAGHPPKPKPQEETVPLDLIGEDQ